jgi:MftR C-terminal domain
VTVAGAATSGEARVSLRQRKKLATRRSLRRIALDLVAERGFVDVTVEADPEHDPYPALLAGAATGVMRAMTPFWARSGGAVPLGQLTDMAFQALAAGLPEDCAVRPDHRRDDR